MEKVIFFKVGKIYELYYEDAIVDKPILFKLSNNISENEIIVKII